jgi:hypothetical protein
VQTHSPVNDPRRASLAPTRSRPSSAGKGAGLSPEVEKMVKRQTKHEKAADRTMMNMNKQLKDLIQQAQAALGTKYDVEGDAMEDDGDTDEEW